MSGAIALPAEMLLSQAQTTAPSAKDLASRQKIEDAAKSFEASFLSMMLQPMFAGVATDGPFGGGQGEAMFKSFLTEAIAKQATKQGGLGIADTVQREMLKLQGLK